MARTKTTKTTIVKPTRKEREIVYWKFMGPNEVACTLCDRHLSRFSDLRRHYWGIHLKKRFYCELCPKSYSQKSGLKTHSRKHTGVKLKCNHVIGEQNGEVVVCDFKTDQDSSMTRHRKAEHGHVPSGPKQRGGRKQNVGDIPEDVLVGRPGAGGEFIPYLPGESFGVYRKCAPTQQARTTSLVHIPQVYGSSLPGTVVHDNGRQTTSRPQQHPLFTLPPLLPRSERQERAVQLPPFATLVRQAHAGSSSWPDHRAPTVLPPTSTSTSFGVGVLATPAPSASSSFSPRPIMTEVNSSQAAVPCAFAMGNYAPQFPSHFQSADSDIPSYRRLRPATYWSTGSRTLAQGGAAGRA